MQNVRLQSSELKRVKRKGFLNPTNITIKLLKIMAAVAVKRSGALRQGQGSPRFESGPRHSFSEKELKFDHEFRKIA